MEKDLKISRRGFFGLIFAPKVIKKVDFKYKYKYHFNNIKWDDTVAIASESLGKNAAIYMDKITRKVLDENG